MTSFIVSMNYTYFNPSVDESLVHEQSFLRKPFSPTPLTKMLLRFRLKASPNTGVNFHLRVAGTSHYPDEPTLATFPRGPGSDFGIPYAGQLLTPEPHLTPPPRPHPNT